MFLSAFKWKTSFSVRFCKFLAARRTALDMLGGAARGAAESTRRFVLEYVREWQPADERSAARVSEALGRLSASINNHDVTLLEKPGHTAGQAHPLGTAGARRL